MFIAVLFIIVKNLEIPSALQGIGQIKAYPYIMEYVRSILILIEYMHRKMDKLQWEAEQ